MLHRSTMVAAAALALGLAAGPAVAQQEGLVNVSVEGNTVQVPVAVAAEVCPNVSADVLSAAVTSQEVVCEIDQDTAAQHNIGSAGGEEEGAAEGEEEEEGG